MEDDKARVLAERMAALRQAKAQKGNQPDAKIAEIKAHNSKPDLNSLSVAELKQYLARVDTPVSVQSSGSYNISAAILNHYLAGMNINTMAGKYGLEPYEVIHILQDHGYVFKEGAVLYDKQGQLPDQGHALEA